MVPQASEKCGLLPSRSPAYRLLHEQRHRFGTGSWHLLRTHDLIALSTNSKRFLAPFPFPEQQPQFGTGAWQHFPTKTTRESVGCSHQNQGGLKCE